MRGRHVAARVGLAIVLGAGVVRASEAPASPVPDFNRDIVPILERRCVSCHNSEKQDGRLNLRDRGAIEQGGESGQKIVSVGFEANELWRRVAGPDAEVRMPPEGPPLDARDLATIERWARAGAPGPMAGASAAHPEEDSPWFLWLVSLVPGRLDPFLERLEESRRIYGSALFLGIALLIVIVVAEDVKRRGKEPSRLVLLLRRYATPATYRWLALAIAAWGVWLHVSALHDREEALQERVASLEKAAKKFTMPPSDFLDKLEPTRPKHPPRLGGTYYRGNDERSPKLFNGGFYRTATMHLALCDEAGHRLAWGDPFPAGDVFVRLEIERAPLATPTLYRPSVMAKAFVSPCRPSVATKDLASRIHRVETIEEGERWVVRVPIECPAPDAAGNVVADGDLFLYNATPDKDRITERPHFGIRYHVVVKRGVIQPGSELWMGSLYRLTKLFFPPAERIVPGEWFDFREIPVIEGSNSTDPELLGVEEHKHKLKD